MKVAPAACSRAGTDVTEKCPKSPESAPELRSRMALTGSWGHMEGLAWGSSERRFQLRFLRSGCSLPSVKEDSRESQTLEDEALVHRRQPCKLSVLLLTSNGIRCDGPGISSFKALLGFCNEKSPAVVL